MTTYQFFGLKDYKTLRMTENWFTTSYYRRPEDVWPTKQNYRTLQGIYTTLLPTSDA